jgi:hypothetical protein
MRINLPPAPERYDRDYYLRAISEIVDTLKVGVSTKEAVGGILLLSPSGLVYSLSVDDGGNLVTTSVELGQRGSTPY